MIGKFDWNSIKFCNDILEEFLWTKKIKSVNEIKKTMIRKRFSFEASGDFFNFVSIF